MGRLIFAGTLVLLLVGSLEVVQAQNWRRQQSGGQQYYSQGQQYYRQQYRPQGRAPRLDPTASSDVYRPQGSYVDPTASSDLYYPPSTQPQYPPYPQPQYPPYPQPQATRKFLGVTTSGTSSGQGVYVRDVVPNSAAFRIGAEPGDIIYSLDGVSVNSPSALSHAIYYSDGFVEVYLRDWRTGQTVMRNADLTR